MSIASHGPGRVILKARRVTSLCIEVKMLGQRMETVKDEWC